MHPTDLPSDNHKGLTTNYIGATTLVTVICVCAVLTGAPTAIVLAALGLATAIVTAK